MFDLVVLIKTAGYLGIFGIVFAETGLLVGLFLPGDSLLFTAGVLASQGFLSILPLCLVTGIAAMMGDNTGYWLGRRFGPSVFSKKGSVLLDPQHIQRAENYFARYGSKTLILARFIPIIRTLAPTLAGVGRMRYRTFLFFSMVSAALWGLGVPLLGFYLGNVIPGIDRYLIPIVALIILVSISPGIYHILRDPGSRARILTVLGRLVRR
jgi:membrane-associated protein